MNRQQTNLHLDFGTGGLRLKSAFYLALFLVCASWGASAQSQTSQSGVIAPPAREGLVPVQLPDTSNMEPEVREHLMAAQGALASAVKDQMMPADKLGFAYGSTGEIYQAYSLNQPARECYQNAVRLAPKDFRWAYLLGKLYETESDARNALIYFDTARNLRPNYLPVLISTGNVYLQLNRLDEAANFFGQALAADQSSAAAEYGLGQVALSKRSYHDAVSHLEKALSLAPAANRLHYALAMAYRGLGDVEQAKSHLALGGTVGVRASDPLLDGLQDLVRGARLHLIRGKTALEARRFMEAADEFRKAIKEQPASIPAHFNLGAALSQAGDLRGAIEQFEETLRLDSSHADAHYNLGLLLARTGEHEQAITHLRTTISLQPGDNNARFLLAQELASTGQLEEAEKELALLAEKDPNNEDFLLARVKILLARKLYKPALVVLEKGHAEFPHKGLTAVTLAYLLAASPQVELRDGARALELARRAFEASATANHGALVAMALAESGRCDEAAEWARRMIVQAEAEGRKALAEKLRAELNRYERARPCRPAADETFSGQANVQ